MATDPAVFASSTLDFDAVIARMIPLKKLVAAEEELRVLFHAGKPCRHVFIDNFFSSDVLDRLVADFPVRGAADPRNDQARGSIVRNLGDIMALAPFTQSFLMQACSRPMMDLLRHVTGYPDLIPDQLFHASGLVEAFRGSLRSLDPAPSRHPFLPLVCRVKLIIYLNRDWDPAWGGALSLSDPAGGGTANMSPLFNRAVLFETSTGALYGIPEPVRCPDERSRKSLVISYWTVAD